MTRPIDFHGNPIELGPWYWAWNRGGNLVGAGRFLSHIGTAEILFYINGAGYDPDSFDVVLISPQPTEKP